MGGGQRALSVAADVAALDACAAELAARELDHGAVHAGQLRALLRMHAIATASGMGIGTVSHAALSLNCSEHRAGRLLDEALLLGELAGGLEAVDCGLLTVEQAQTVVRLLSPVSVEIRQQVWRRLRDRLVLEADRGSTLAPARLAELLRDWVQAADQAGAQERRRRAEQGRRIDGRRTDDGLMDLFAFGFTGPEGQAVLSRIRDRSAPVGPDDDRTAEQRRFDAFKDLLLGRDPLPVADPHDPTEPCACTTVPAGGGRAACGCLPGAPVPCGAELLVHLSVHTAVGVSDQPAELVGHGPIEADLLGQLLLAAPRLRPLWTDEHGVPVAVGDKVIIPERGDAASVRQALLQLAALPPPSVVHPRHPHDHPPDREGHGSSPPSEPGRLQPPALAAACPDDAAFLGAAALGAAHPAGTPGSYRVPRRLRRLIETRAPRCEWPGCGVRAVRCDAEHDQAWPQGPTCACNLGPCCRRHHRVKQLGWTKTRAQSSAVTWTSPGRGRSWLSPSQHEPPAPAVRPMAPVPGDNPWDQLAPWEQEEELWWLAGCPDDPAGLELRATEEVPPERDLLGEHLSTDDTSWTLDLDDPYLWQDVVPHSC